MKRLPASDAAWKKGRARAAAQRRRRWVPFFAVVLLCLGSLPAVQAGTADEDWQAVVALDTGPGAHPQSFEAASAAVLNHLARQEQALRTFLGAHPGDSHVFEGQLRLARLLQIRADFESSEKLRAEATHLLETLDKTATPEQRPELEFAKIARMMRVLHRSDPAQCEALLAAARRFQGAYPNDRRVAALFAEVATLFDNQPKIKEALLADALPLAREPDLKARIRDDLKRVHLLGEVVPLSFTSVQGQEIGGESLLGRPVFVIFFGDFSTPAMAAVAKLQQAVADLPAGSVRVIGVSLDDKREPLLAALKSHGIAWPVAFDGKGWEGPLVRSLGINALPTVWLLDSHGRLRSLNALDSAAGQARQLLRER